MILHVCSHCWKYSRLLMYQLSSIVNHPPKFRVNDLVVSVCYCPEDEETKKVLEFFSSIQVKKVIWDWVQLSKPDLTNRAIGRNLVALESKADWLWYADCDYIVQEGFFDSMCHTLFNQCARDKLVYPEVTAATTKEYGMRLIQEASGEPRIVEVENDPKKIILQKFKKAIGGIQFSPVKHLQNLEPWGKPIGYLNCRPRYRRPHTSGNWAPDLEDRRFRVSLGTPGRPINCPGLIRIRHSERGGSEKIVNL